MTSFSTSALLIATALYCVDPQTRMRASSTNMADALYETVGGLGLTDESKADVYATLAEKLTDKTGFKDAQGIIASALRAVKHG